MTNWEKDLICLINSVSRWLKKNWREILVYGIILLAPFLVYVSGLTFGMTYFDDNDIITDHLDLYRTAGSFGEIVWQRDAFLEKNDEQVFYFRPLQNASFWLDVRAAGVNAPDFTLHLHNLILFCLIGGLVYYLLRNVFLVERRWALFLSLFFVLNPLFVSLAVWIPARGDLLITFWGLISFLAFGKLVALPHHGYKRAKFISVLVCWLSFSLAFFSKETALVWPVIFLIYAGCFGPKATQKKAKKLSVTAHKTTSQSSLIQKGFIKSLRQLTTTPFLILIGLSLITVILWWCQRSSLAPKQIDLSLTTFLTHWRVFPEILANFFWPVGIKIVPLFNSIDTLVGLVILVILLWMAWFINPKRPLAQKLFGLIWWLLFTLPPLLSEFSSINNFVDYVNHRAFLPTIGILIFLGVINSDPLAKLKKWHYDIIIIILLVGIFGYISYRDSQNYSGDLVFWQLATQQSPEAAYAFYNLGTVYQNRNKITQSIENFTKAIELNDHDARFYNNRGLAYSYQKNYQLAKEDYDRALELDPTTTIAYNNRALIKYRYLADSEGALQDLDLSLQLAPNDPMALSLRALVKEDLGDFTGAWTDVQAGLKITPRATALLDQAKTLQQKISQENIL